MMLLKITYIVILLFILLFTIAALEMYYNLIKKKKSFSFILILITDLFFFLCLLLLSFLINSKYFIFNLKDTLLWVGSIQLFVFAPLIIITIIWLLGLIKEKLRKSPFHK